MVEQHADGAAVWLRRDEAVRSLDYALRELAERDDRLDAHLQGLRFAGKATGKKPAMIDENVSPCTKNCDEVSDGHTSMNPVSGSTLDECGSSGAFVVREVVRFAFFVRQPHRVLAPTVVEAIDRVIDLFPPPALSMFSVESGDWIGSDADGLKTEVRKRLIGKDKPINGTVSLSGNQANLPDFILDYEGFAIDRPAFGKSAASLRFNVSATAFGPYLHAALRLSREIAELLDCSAGYIDLALDGDQARIQALARRYRALDISDPSCVAEDIEDRLPGVFWQNIIGPRLAGALGGRAMLESVLSGDARVEETGSGGLVVTLGAAPIRGDVNRRGGLGDRAAIAHLALHRGLLHVPRDVTYFEPEDDLSDSEAQEKWHLRYVA